MNYVAPEFEIVSLETVDIVTASLAIQPGDNETSVPKNWWD